MSGTPEANDSKTPGANAVLEAIHSRRSDRKFQSKPVPEAALEAIVKAALRAPNARNQQKWHFTMIASQDLLRRLSAKLKDLMLSSGVEFLVERARTPGYDPFYGAPALLMISGDSQAGWIQLDCGAAVENAALAAESLGLASCVMAMPGRLFAADDAAELAKSLGIPEGYAHMISLAVGYREGERPAATPRNKDVVTWVR